MASSTMETMLATLRSSIHHVLALPPLFACVAGAQAQVTLVDGGSVWRFLDDGSDPGIAWRTLGFDDSSWGSGPARLGYGGDEVTTLSFGPDPSQRHITSYFRLEFQVPDPSAFIGLELRVARDDGAAVYLNGQEVLRDNLPAGPLASTTTALSEVFNYRESYRYPTFLRADDLVTGTNVVAVELHQDSPTSPDAGLELALLGHGGPSVIRGPYLQNVRTDGAVVRWRTLAPTVGQVWVGPDPAALAPNAVEATATTEHEVEVLGLRPDETVYYAVGVAGATAPQTAGDVTTRIHTPPRSGSRRPLRAWVLGDPGTLTDGQNRVRDALLAGEAQRPADLVLLLGDNAYRAGLDSEYQHALFEAYPTILRRLPAWSTRGNHEVDAANYFRTFTMPVAGEAGGVPSGTEAYYSFDWANVHFVCLDSEGSDRSVGGAMWSWADHDLGTTTQEWIVAFWHHSPYSRGPRNSDVDPGMTDMRRNFLPLLESHGVALVLGGHSHVYERTGLIRGHYGLSTTFDPATHAVDPGNGRPEGTGAYVIDRSMPVAGSVYVVAGCSGQVSSAGTLDHPAVVHSSRDRGALVLDVAGGRLDVTFMDEFGAPLDRFTLTRSSSGETYCDAPVDGLGCVASLSTVGDPSVSSGSPFVVQARDLRRQVPGLLVYGFDARTLEGPFNGILCVGGGTRRTAVQSSGGTAPCSGAFSFDFGGLWNDPQHPGLTPGTTIRCQFWHRDSTVGASTLTEALSFTVLP